MQSPGTTVLQTSLYLTNIFFISPSPLGRCVRVPPVGVKREAVACNRDRDLYIVLSTAVYPKELVLSHRCKLDILDGLVRGEKRRRGEDKGVGQFFVPTIVVLPHDAVFSGLLESKDDLSTCLTVG